MKTIQIDLPGNNYRYDVKIGSGVLKKCLGDLWPNYSEKTVFLVTNVTIEAIYKKLIADLIPKDIRTEVLVLPDGEQYKDLKHLAVIYDFLTEGRANRKTVLVALGGGVIGDMVGFVAATFMRGVPCVQIPTTLLSQVDSGIGGKTGINHSAGKNLIGAFKQPLQTIIDVDFLDTLPERELIAGYAELIKHGFIKDPYLFQLLRQKTIQSLIQDKTTLVESIFRSCEVKARVVEADEKESGQRAILNFGHTIGHFLETYTNYQQMLHGEAVIIGMDFAAWWSYQNGYLDKNDHVIIHEHLDTLGIRHSIPRITKERFQTIVERDKKFTSSTVRFVALSSIGNAVIVEDVTSDNLWELFEAYVKLSSMLRFS